MKLDLVTLRDSSFTLSQELMLYFILTSSLFLIPQFHVPGWDAFRVVDNAISSAYIMNLNSLLSIYNIIYIYNEKQRT